MRVPPRVAIVLAVLSSLGAGPAMPVQAAPVPTRALAVVGQATLVVAPGPGVWNVCGTGRTGTGSFVTGTWLLQVGGTAGTPIPVARLTGSSPSFSGCLSVRRLGLPAGQIEASLTYVGAVTYVMAGSVGGATWGPVIGDQPYTMDLRRCEDCAL